MQTKTAKAVAGVTVVVLAVALFLVFKGRSDDGNAKTSTTSGFVPRQARAGAKPAKPPVPTIVIAHGKPVGGIEELAYTKGETIRFRIASDVADEVHVHGYGISREVTPEGWADFDFPAELEGIFEVELEQRAVQIAELAVEP